MSSRAQDIPLIHSSRSSGQRVDRFDLICVVVLLLSFVAVSHLPAAPAKYGDKYFHQEAKALVHAFHRTSPWTDVTFARAPGPSIYYAIPYMFVSPYSSDDMYWKIAFGWNIFWMMAAVFLIRRAGSLLANAAAGKMAANLTLIVPLGVYYSFGVSAETPAFVAAAIFLYGWARWQAEGNGKFTSASALIMFAGMIGLILCRPNVLVVLGIALLCGGFLWLRRSPRAAANAKLAILCFVIGLATSTIATKAIERLPANKGGNLQAANLDDVLFFGSFQFRNEPWDWRFWGRGTRVGSIDYQNWSTTHDQLQQISNQTGLSIYLLEWRWTIQDILHHPLTRLKMFGVRALNMNVWIEHSSDPGAFHLGPFRGRWAYIAFHVLLNAVLLIPFLGSVWFVIAYRAYFFETWPLWAVWVGLLVFHAFTYAEPRYMLPSEPGLVLMAACMFARSSKATPQLAFENPANS